MTNKEARFTEPLLLSGEKRITSGRMTHIMGARQTCFYAKAPGMSMKGKGKNERRNRKREGGKGKGKGKASL
jgi:hypothetical protein